MTHQSIYINHQGELLLIDAPEKPKLLEDFSERLPMLTMQYEAALASAIAKGVKFKDNQATLKILIGSIFKTNVVDEVHPKSRFIEVNKGQIFSLPTGYKVNFEGDFTKEKACRKCDCNFPMQYSRCDCPCHDIDETVAILSKLEEDGTNVIKIIGELNAEIVKRKVVAPSEEVKHFLLGKKIRYRYVDWEEGSFTPWSPCTERELKTILEDHSIEIVQFKP